MQTSNVLVVCYSRTGATRTLAGALGRALQCPIEDVVDTTPRLGVFRYLKCGFDAWFGRLTTLGPVTHDPSHYDLVVVATPVWNHSLPPATRTYLSLHKAAFRRVAFVCTETVSGAGHAFQQMTQACGRAPVAVLALRHDDVTEQRSIPSISDFIDEIAHARVAA
jgi:flavodoxin